MNIIENLTPKEKEEPKSGIDDEFSFTVDSAGAKNEVADWNGQTVKTEELEQDPQVKETEEGEVIELAKFKDDTEVTELNEDTLSLTISEIREHSSFFTEEELSTLLDEKRHISDDEKESINKVEEALNDPSLPNDRRSLWLHLCKEEGKFGMDNEEELSEAEKDAKAVEALERRGYDVDPDHPDNMSIQEMDGSTFKQVVSDALGESESTTEELEENHEEETEISQIQKPDTEIAELAADSFSERGGYWEEFSEDLAKESELPDTRIESLESDGFVQVRTTWDELQAQLMELHNKDEKRTQVLDMRDDGTMVARAFEGDLE